MEDPSLSALLVHEIANPIHNISAVLNLMEEYLIKKEQRVAQPVERLVKLLQEEIKRLTLLLTTFRSLDPFRLRLNPVCLTDIVNHCLRLESAKATHRGISIVSDISFSLPLIEMDEPKFKQVIFNLCENAIDAMPNGGTLIVRGYANENELCLDIIDNGEGIPDEIDAFTPFVTTKGDGMGLGLFIVRRIVSAHGGAINYVSKKGEGTTFHLAFPIRRNEIINNPGPTAPLEHAVQYRA